MIIWIKNFGNCPICSYSFVFNKKNSIAGQIYYIDLIKLNGKIFTFKIKYDPK